MSVDIDELERIGREFRSSIIDNRYADLRETNRMLRAARDHWQPMIDEIRQLRKVVEQYSPKCDLCGVFGIDDEFTERPVPHPTEGYPIRYTLCSVCGSDPDVETRLKEAAEKFARA